MFDSLCIKPAFYQEFTVLHNSYVEMNNPNKGLKFKTIFPSLVLATHTQIQMRTNTGLLLEDEIPLLISLYKTLRFVLCNSCEILDSFVCTIRCRSD